MVALLLLTVGLVLGVMGPTSFRTIRLPRFAVSGLHRNVTLLALAFVSLHVVTTIIDGYTSIGLRDAFLPFIASYRPFWLGLGTVAFDLLLALIVTSLLRNRLGLRAWRAVHWLAYASWPVALLHSLGTGSDARSSWLVLLASACTIAVVAAALWRVATAARGGLALRFGVGTATVALALGALVWFRDGPDRAGWARRAGTPDSVAGFGEDRVDHHCGSYRIIRGAAVHRAPRRAVRRVGARWEWSRLCGRHRSDPGRG